MAIDWCGAFPGIGNVENTFFVNVIDRNRNIVEEWNAEGVPDPRIMIADTDIISERRLKAGGDKNYCYWL
jgi:hypothetical protein